MGKKSTYKKLRRIASEMQTVQMNVVKGELIEGTELEKEGIKEVEGKPINTNIKYRKKTIVQQPLNHYRQMKKLYRKNGLPMVGEYIQAVDRHVTSMKIREQQQKEIIK